MGALIFSIGDTDGDDAGRPAEPHRPRSLLSRTVAPGWIAAFIAGWLGTSQLLLWRFLDRAPLWAYPLGLALTAGLCVALIRGTRRDGGPNVATLLLCLAVALILLLLGGEGRFFYANIDWQVRAAVLRDMGANPWPFVYMARGAPDVLRAPIGMFLWPALAFKAWGPRAADIALLLQNGLLVGGLLALGSTLFATRKARWIALITILAFSGLDALGRVLFRGGLSDHLENWAYLQFSSTITLASWVPQHALAGWIGAVGFLSWRAGRLPLGGFLSLLPLTALWSPLGLMGALPFAALAGAQALIGRTSRWSDIAPPALATLLCIPSLLYLSAANDAVGIRIVALPPLQWGLFEALEVLVYLVPLALAARKRRFGVAPLIVAGLWLLVIPFVQIGSSTDFMMRGSITALAVLSVLVADALTTPGRVRVWLTVMLLIGSVTGLFEIARALRHPPMPAVRCSFFKAWDQSFAAFPKDSYLAPLSRMPAAVRPAEPARASAVEPAACWDGHWYHPDRG
ncbi:MAG: hypothetical protein QHC40_05410 [Sphingobium sp.]|nr:hypothetical protein [Sphingobium sp.]